MSEKSDIKREVRAIYDAIAQRGTFEPRSVTVRGGRDLALNLGYPEWFLDTLEEEHLRLFAGGGFPHPREGEWPKGPALDLGCGAGIDSLYAAEAAGIKVVGVDFTLGLLKSASRFSRRRGARKVSFACGDFTALPFPDGYFSLALSNCALSIVMNKPLALKEASRVLSPGGAICLCDIAATGPLPEELKEDPSAWAFCAAGALTLPGYVGLVEAAGFTGVETRVLEENHPLASFFLGALKKV